MGRHRTDVFTLYLPTRPHPSHSFSFSLSLHYDASSCHPAIIASLLLPKHFFCSYELFFIFHPYLASFPLPIPLSKLFKILLQKWYFKLLSLNIFVPNIAVLLLPPTAAPPHLDFLFSPPCCFSSHCIPPS